MAACLLWPLFAACGQQTAAEAAGAPETRAAHGAGSPVTDDKHSVSTAEVAGQTGSVAANDSLAVGLAALVPDGATLLAHEVIDLNGDGQSDGVLVFRNENSAQGENPCELLVAVHQGEGFTVQAHSRHIVECTYNQVAARAKSLQENLAVNDGVITYTNQLEKGTSVYSFAYDAKRGAWHLVEATNAYPQYNEAQDRTEVVREVVRSPGDVPWGALDAFDPEALGDAFKKNRSIME